MINRPLHLTALIGLAVLSIAGGSIAPAAADDYYSDDFGTFGDWPAQRRLELPRHNGPGYGVWGYQSLEDNGIGSWGSGSRRELSCFRDGLGNVFCK